MVPAKLVSTRFGDHVFACQPGDIYEQFPCSGGNLQHDGFSRSLGLVGLLTGGFRKLQTGYAHVVGFLVIKRHG
jgi:hypothetical protein